MSKYLNSYLPFLTIEKIIFPNNHIVDISIDLLPVTEDQADIE